MADLMPSKIFMSLIISCDQSVTAPTWGRGYRPQPPVVADNYLPRGVCIASNFQNVSTQSKLQFVFLSLPTIQFLLKQGCKGITMMRLFNMAELVDNHVVNALDRGPN